MPRGACWPVSSCLSSQMKFFNALLCCILWFATLPLLAAPARPTLPVIGPADTGATAYSEWADGAEKPVAHLDGKGVAQPVRCLWGLGAATDVHPVSYGDSKMPGIRHLRIAFEKPVTVGSILARGDGRVSVLKPGVSSGSMADDSLWIAAARLKNGRASDEEPAPGDEVLWALPKTVTTRAIRFTHTAQPTDKSYAGTIAGAALLPSRWANLAPQALASASASDQNASRLNDESANNDSKIWDNISARDGERAQTIAEKPEWAMLVWPRPVTLGGVALLGNEFGEAEIQCFVGPAGKHPREAAEANWKTLQTLSKVKPQSAFDLQPVYFPAPVTTRALRIRFTGTYVELPNLRLLGRTRSGKRVGLGEWVALDPLDTAGIEAAVLPVDQLPESYPPIPIKFAIPDDGEVTLVIEDASGKRVRNLVSQAPFPKGENTAWWDGTDDLGRDPAAPAHGVYIIPPKFVAPGSYAVRGIWHKPLDLRYEFSVYSPGDPPWPTTDAAGGWMTNHTPASSMVSIPAAKAPGGQPLIGMGAHVSEGGSAFSWVNLDGKKIGGRGWIGGSWTGGAIPGGRCRPSPEPNVAAYVGSVFEGNKKYGVNGKIEVRLTKLGTLLSSGDQPVLKETILLDPLPVAPAAAPDATPAPKAEGYLGGLAVRDGLLVISETVLNKIILIDAKAGKILGEERVPDPRALAFDSQGRLLLLSGNALLRYPRSLSAEKFPDAQKLITGLEDPRGITIDPAGRIFIADQGNSHQVKTFSPDGKPLTVYGKPGAPTPGPYDPLHMNHPRGLAVDANGRLWVAEHDFHPKRVSVWNADGTLWKAFYGPSKYGGGGILDPRQKGTFLYDGMEFRLDWEKGSYQLTRVYYRPREGDLQMAFRSAPPEAPVYFNGRRYLTNAYNCNGTSGHNSAFIFLDKGDGGAVVPVAAAGSANHWPVLQTDAFKNLWPKELKPSRDGAKEPAFFIWSDLNGDAQVQPEEVKIIAGISGGITVGDDGSILVSRLGPDADHLQAMRFKPSRFADQAVPVYAIEAGEALRRRRDRAATAAISSWWAQMGGWS